MGNLPELGVGMLIHNSKRYTDYLKEIGDVPKVFELVLAQYDEEPEELNRLKQTLNRPLLLHCAYFSMGTDAPINPMLIQRIRDAARRCEAPWCSDHFCFTGIPGLNSGALLPPILDDEALDVFIKRVKESRKLVDTHLILENVVMHYNPIGSMSLSDFINRVVDATGIGILLSIENISQCNEAYYPLDHYKFIDSLPSEKIVEVHCTIGNQEQQRNMPSKLYGTFEQKQQLHYDVLEYLAKVKKVRPKALIWELETDTEALPEVSNLVDRIHWAENLFFSKEVSLV